MHTIEQFDLSALPEPAQDELYHFYLFLKQQYQEQTIKAVVSDTTLLSEKSLAEDWDKQEEADAWQAYQ
jgi:hypothetical protein